MHILEPVDTGSFHGDEWLFSSDLLPSYEKGDPVRRRLYEAIKNVCHFGLSNVMEEGERKQRGWQRRGRRRGKRRVHTSERESKLIKRDGEEICHFLPLMR